MGIAEAMGFFFSTLGQMHVSATRTALLLSLEAVICACVAYLCLNECLTTTEIIGCVVMFSATLITAIPSAKTEEDESSTELLHINSDDRNDDRAYYSSI